MDCVCLYAARSFCIRLFVLPLSCMHCAAHRRQNGAAYFLLSFGGGLLPHQKRAPLFDAAADVCNDFAAVLQQLLRLSVYARMEIYGIFGRRQCVVYAVSCAAFACGMGAHQAVVRTVRRLRRPFRLRRSSSFGLGLVCVGHCLGLLLHARPQRPPGFAAVRYLYGNCRVALAWRAAPIWARSICNFSVCFFRFCQCGCTTARPAPVRA